MMSAKLEEGDIFFKLLTYIFWYWFVNILKYWSMSYFGINFFIIMMLPNSDKIADILNRPCDPIHEV